MSSFAARKPVVAYRRTAEDKRNRSQLGYVKVATVHDIPRGEGKTCKVLGHEIAIFHLTSGEIMAVDNTCPHRGGPLSHGILSGEVVSCPLHGFKLNLRSGRAASGEERVKVHPVRLRGSVILVQL